jgi:transposase
MVQVFGDEFRRETVRLARTSGLSRERIAADLRIGKSTLAKWIQLDSKLGVQSGGKGPSAAPVVFDLLKKNELLRHESRLLREETDIVKKATQCFKRLPALTKCSNF